MSNDSLTQDRLRRWFPIHRRTEVDVAVIAQNIPSFPLYREMPLGELEDIRRRTQLRMGWAALLAWSYSKVCMEIPELRDIYVRRPIPYLFRSPDSVGSITVHRLDDAGNRRLIWGRIRNAHNWRLLDVQTTVDRFKTDPIASVYGDGLRMERRVGPVRGLVWWLLMQWAGYKRAKHVGTFSISNLGGSGVLNAHHPLITTSSLAMAPIAATGKTTMALICDHRVLDGAIGAAALARLEDVLLTDARNALLHASEKSQAA